jgi:hypothetical protein
LDWTSSADDGKPGGGDDVFMVEYTTMVPAAPMADGAGEALIEESPLPAGAGDTEVDDNVDDENLDADHDDDAPLHFRNKDIHSKSQNVHNSFPPQFFCAMLTCLKVVTISGSSLPTNEFLFFISTSHK